MATVSLQAMYDDARRLLESGDASRVIGRAQHMLAHYPEYLEAYRILGEAYLADRQIQKASDAFARVLRSDPENIPAHVGLGIAYERAGKPAEAIAEFETALEIKPDLAELRSQLLRLYTDNYGSENAQLRLNKAGLARLYVKGHMLPQAIQEFRTVVAEQPGRLDTQVALAETLWRDGQADLAVEVAAQTLQEYPEALKPNLIVGYNLLSGGNPEGQKFWDKARALDPYMGVAQTLFETLPDTHAAQPALPEWDEQSWQQEQERLRQEEQATREALPEPALAAAGLAGAAAASGDDDLFGDTWLSDLTAPSGAAEHAQAFSRPSEPADDDFLAALLGAESPRMPLPTEPLGGEDVDPDVTASIVAPFSLDDLDEGAGSQPQAQPFSLDDLDEGAGSQPQAQPFSLDDLDEGAGPQPFSLDDLADTLASSDYAAAPAEPSQSAQEIAPAEAITPFSFDDFDLDSEAEPGQEAAPAAPAEELSSRAQPFSLDELDEDVSSPTPLSLQDLGLDEPQPPPSEPELRPFSLADLGLSEEEIASLAVEAPPATPEATPAPPAEDTNLPAELKPFSLDELDLDFGGEQAPGAPSALPQSLQPFSLDDATLGLGDVPLVEEEPVALPPIVPDEEQGAAGAFSWGEPSSRLGSNFTRSTPEPEKEDIPDETSIFSKLLQRRKADEDERVEEPQPEPAPIADDELDMSLFSLDDISLRDDDLGAAEAPHAAASAPATEDAEPPAPLPVPTPPAAEDAEPEMVPFSLAELGLSEEEIAALGLGDAQPAAQQPAEPAVEELGPSFETDFGLFAEPPPEEAAPIVEPPAEEPPAPLPAPTPPAAADAEPELVPFSLSELGLSEEEIAALDLDDSADEEVPADDQSGLGLSREEIEAFDFGDFALTSEQPAASAAPAAQPQAVEPFDFSGLDSLNDLDTEPDTGVDADAEAFDLSGLDDLGPSPTRETPPPPADLAIDDIESAVSEGALQPFSLADLGLSPEEIAALGLDTGGDTAPAEETSLASFANDFDLPVPEPLGNAEVAPDDPSLQRLLALGQRQGYLDINDIIAEVTDPVAEADRIESIGQQLHASGIEIRDGDEVIDMDELEYADEEFEGEADVDSAFDAAFDTFAGASSRPQEAPAGTPAPSDEPDLTPFSLADLGLSEEEIAALGLGEAGVAAPSEPTPAAPEELPALFAALDEPTPAVPEEPAPVAMDEPSPMPDQPGEPDLTPFSLADLGLTPEEIAMLSAESSAGENLGEPPLASLEELGIDLAEEEATDDDLLAGLESLGNLDDVAQSAPPAPPAEAQPEKAAPPKPAGLSAEEKAALVEKKDLVSNLLADLRTTSAERKEPPPPLVAESPVESLETFETLVPSIDAPPAPVPVATPAPTRASAPPPAVDAQEGGAVIDEYLKQLKADPDNDSVRLAVARLGGQVGRRDIAIDQYKLLIKKGALLEPIVDDLLDLIGESSDNEYLRRLHRLLGDAYSKQGRFQQAINEYSWTLTRG